METNKEYSSFRQAVADIPDGASIMIGLFAGPAGMPQNLILALRNHGAKNLTVICSNFGFGIQTKTPKPFISPAILVDNGQVRKAIVNWTRSNSPGEISPLEQAVKAGKVELELMPMGVQTTRMKAGGMGIEAFYSPIGIGTVYERGKEKRVFNGKEYLLEYPLRADYGFVRACKADKLGNLTYKGTERAANPLVAKACDVTIAEVDEIVESGEIAPDHVVTPGMYLDRIIPIPEGGWK